MEALRILFDKSKITGKARSQADIRIFSGTVSGSRQPWYVADIGSQGSFASPLGMLCWTAWTSCSICLLRRRKSENVATRPAAFGSVSIVVGASPSNKLIGSLSSCLSVLGSRSSLWPNDDSVCARIHRAWRNQTSSQGWRAAPSGTRSPLFPPALQVGQLSLYTLQPEFLPSSSSQYDRYQALLQPPQHAPWRLQNLWSRNSSRDFHDRAIGSYQPLLRDPAPADWWLTHGI